MLSGRKFFVFMFAMALSSAGCDREEIGVLHKCGSLCPHVSPQSISRQSLLESYRASALGRDLPVEAQVAAARALQDLLRTGDYRHETRWQLPDRGTPKGRFSLLSVRQEKAAPCVKYFQEIIFPTKTLKGQGKTCREHSGLWRIVEEYPFGIR